MRPAIRAARVSKRSMLAIRLRPARRGFRGPRFLLNANAALSGEMALRIEKAFGVKMDTLMRMQASYDIAQTRKREKQIHVRRFRQLAQTHA